MDSLGAKTYMETDDFYVQALTGFVVYFHKKAYISGHGPGLSMCPVISFSAFQSDVNLSFSLQSPSQGCVFHEFNAI